MSEIAFEAEPPVARVRGAPRAFAWALLLAANLAWFGWMWTHGVPLSPSGSLAEFGALNGPLVAAGDWWRLLTCMFVHVGLLHLCVNMYALYAIGPAVERLYGSATFVVLYFLSGLGGSLASFAWRPEGSSAGASGAIFGLLGALLAFTRRHRNELPRGAVRAQTRSLLVVIAINIAIGLTVPMVDNAGHVGGLVLGFVAGFTLDRDLMEEPRLSRRRVARASLIVLVLAALFPAILWRARSHPRAGSVAHGERAKRALLAGDLDGAAHEAEAALAADPTLALASAVLAEVHGQRGDLEGARREWDRAVANDPENAPMRFLRGRLRFLEGDVQKALEDFERAVHLDPDSAQFRLVHGQALVAAERFEDARRELVHATASEDVALEAAAWAWLARARSGAPAPVGAALEGVPEPIARNSWLRALAGVDTRTLAGADALESAARSTPMLDARTQLVLGELSLARGDRDGALRRFERAAELYQNVRPDGAEPIFVAFRLRALER